jgi:hypothetical protein
MRRTRSRTRTPGIGKAERADAEQAQLHDGRVMPAERTRNSTRASSAHVTEASTPTDAHPHTGPLMSPAPALRPQREHGCAHRVRPPGSPGARAATCGPHRYMRTSGCRRSFAKSSDQAGGTRYPSSVACLLEHAQGSFDVVTCLVMSSARMSRHRQVEEDVGFPARVTECLCEGKG